MVGPSTMANAAKMERPATNTPQVEAPGETRISAYYPETKSDIQTAQNWKMEIHCSVQWSRKHRNMFCVNAQHSSGADSKY
ncbi:hypothetical protein ACLKA6_011377 [Drosophila palustris]